MRTFTIDQLERSIEEIESYPFIQDVAKKNIKAALDRLRAVKALSLLSYRMCSMSSREIFDKDPVAYERALFTFMTQGLWNNCVPADIKLPNQGVVFVYGVGSYDRFVEPGPLCQMPDFSFKKWKLLEVFHQSKMPTPAYLAKLENSGHNYYVVIDRPSNSYKVYFSTKAVKSPPGPFVPKGVTFH